MAPRIRALLRTAYVALGATSIYLTWLLAPFVSRTHSTVYHWSGRASDLFLPPAIDFCAVWLLLTVAFLMAQAPGWVRRVVWGATIAFTPCMALKNWAYVMGTQFRPTIMPSLFCAGLALFLIFLLLRSQVCDVRFERIVTGVSTFFLFAGLSGIIVLGEVAWFGLQTSSLNPAVTLHRVKDQPAHGDKSRIFWIVFDELSYAQVYERRFEGLQLPAFDALAGQATVFTHTIPAGILTDRVLPALMTGRPVNAIRASSDSRRLSLHNSVTGAWESFDEHNTVFEDALQMNYGTAVAGWYHPYCRILPEVLDHCFWTYSNPTENILFPRMSFRSNLATPLIQFVGGRLGHRVVSFFHEVPEFTRINAEQHIFDYEALAEATDRILDDRSAGFVMIHLPVPHPGGIYDRRAERMVTNHSTYVDNLALTDKFLGHVRAKLEKRGEWDSSAVVLMGDHSWRLGAFEREPRGLVEEERIASLGGKFDDRPAYVVKLPNQRTSTHIDEPFAALNTRGLLDALFSQKIRSGEDLSAWVKQTRN